MKKASPPSGYTGVGAPDPGLYELTHWSRDFPDGNVALRMPEDVIGIDVDSYKGKHGEDTLHAAVCRFGPLPETWFSSARGGQITADEVSGIFFFRVPAHMTFPGKLEIDGHSDVEIIQRSHRYAVVWPSVHPEGMTYRWYAPDGSVSTVAPLVTDLPYLPNAWIDGLREQGGRIGEAGQKEHLTDDEAMATLRRFNQGEPCDVLKYRLGDALERLENHADARHDAMVSDVMSMVGLARHGHPGIVKILSEYRNEFVAAISDREDMRGAKAEFQRSLHGALELVSLDTLVQSDPCTDQGPEDLSSDIEEEVQAEVRRLKVRELAKRRVADEKSSQDRSLPDVVPAAEIVDATEEEVQWRIEGLIPKGSIVLLHASAKAGKSIVLTHLIRSIVEGDQFLGRCQGYQPDGMLGLADMELTRPQIGRRTRQIISRYDGIYVMPLRGRGRNLDVLDESHYVKLVDLFKRQNTEVLIIDPVGPIIRGRGVEENDNTAMGELLDAFSRLKEDAGIGELIISHHAGHSDSGRSRGASVLMDWPDVLISLDKRGNDSDEGDTAATRVLSAKGRDIDFPRVDLQYDPVTFELIATDKQERAELKKINGLSTIADLVEANPGINKSELKAQMKEAGVKGSSEVISGLIAEAIQEIPLRVERGPRNSVLLFLE